MARFGGRIATVAMQALLFACGGGSRQTEPPTAVPAPAAQPRVAPQYPAPSVPAPTPDPKTPKGPKDSVGGGPFPWQSAPIAAL
jgi:hypothetical protein